MQWPSRLCVPGHHVNQTCRAKIWFRRAAPLRGRATGVIKRMPELGRTQTFTKIDIDRDGRTVWPY
jgi:hypothetical protein